MTRSPDHPIKVLLAANHRLDLWTVPAWFSERLSRDFPQVKVVTITNSDAAVREISDAEIALTPSIRPEQFLAAKKLRWIHSPSAAVHQFLFPEFLNSDVILT